MSLFHLEYPQHGCSVHHLKRYLFTMQKCFIYQEVNSCKQIDGKSTVERDRVLDSKINAGNPSSVIVILFYIKLIT